MPRAAEGVGGECIYSVVDSSQRWPSKSLVGSPLLQCGLKRITCFSCVDDTQVMGCPPTIRLQKTMASVLLASLLTSRLTQFDEASDRVGEAHKQESEGLSQLTGKD